MKRRPFQMQHVLLFANSVDESLDVVIVQLEAIGLTAQVVTTPGEVIWRLEDEQRYVAVMIDVDLALPDRYQLVAFLRERHPDVRRLFIMTSPSVSELEGCRVADKRNLVRDLELALAA